MSYAVHNKGHSGPAILVFLTFLALLMVVFLIFFIVSVLRTVYAKYTFSYK